MLHRIAARVSLGCTGLIIAASPALAQGLLERYETQGAAFGRAGAAWLGPTLLILAAIIGIGAIWALYAASRRNNQGQGLYMVAIMGLVAASIAAGFGGFLSLGANTFTGGAPTASVQPLTLGR